MTTLVKAKSEDIEVTAAAVASGDMTLSIPLRPQVPVLNDINRLGYALLHNALREMSPWEIGFCASMVKAQEITEGQRSQLKRISAKYLGLDIDANTVALSGLVPEITRLSKRKEPVERKKKSTRRSSISAAAA